MKNGLFPGGLVGGNYTYKKVTPNPLSLGAPIKYYDITCVKWYRVHSKDISQLLLDQITR